MKVGRYDFIQGTDVKHKNKTTTAAASTKVEKTAAKSASPATNQVAIQSFAETLAKASTSTAPVAAPMTAAVKSSLPATPPQTMSAPLNQVPAQAAQALAQDTGKTAQLEGLKSNLDAAAASQDDKKIRLAAREFEAIFMGMMFKTMKSTVEDGGLIEKSYAREMFEGMYLDEVGKSIAGGKGTGLGEMMYKQMSRDFGKKDVAATENPAVTPSTAPAVNDKKVEATTKG